MRSIVSAALPVMLAAFMASACSRDAVSISVSAGDFDRTDCVVRTVIPAADGRAVLSEVTGMGRRRVPCQTEPSADGLGETLYFTLDGLTRAGETREFRLSRSRSNVPSGSQHSMEAADDGSDITLMRDGSPILSYRYEESYPDAGTRPIFARSGYIHPVCTPSGYVVTCIRPKDHPHHFGIWNPWTRVVYRDDVYDLWNIGDSLGTVRAREIGRTYSGEVMTGLDASLDHVIYTDGGEVRIMDELWRLRAVDAGSGYMWELESTLRNVTDDPLTFQAYRYQGFCLRATEDWTAGTCTVRSSEESDRDAIDGTRERWIYVTGKSDSGVSGILLMTCPGNHNYPEHLRIWDSYQNGGRGDVMINICPAKFEDWMIPAGSETVLRYGVYTFDGEMTDTEAERIWTDFAMPPEVTVR